MAKAAVAGAGIFLLLCYLAIASLFSMSQSAQIAAHSLSEIDFPQLGIMQSQVVDSTYTDLPFTEHALKGHTGETWNARTIAVAFATGMCKPQIDFCEKDDAEIHWCELPGQPGHSIALVIGHTIRQIITGFQAPMDYWSQRCQSK